MPNEGKRLHKQFIQADGIYASRDAAVVLDGGADIGGAGTNISQLISAAVTVSLNLGSTIGSLAYSRDTAVSGVQPGDVILANPVASTPLGLMWSACCYTAGVVQIRGIMTGSWATAAIAGTSWRIIALRFK